MERPAMFVHSQHQQKSCPTALYLSQQVRLVGLSYGGGGIGLLND